MADTLTYDLRAGVLRGHLAGRIISVPVDPSSANAAHWSHEYEFRSGKWTAAGSAHRGGKGYVLTSIQHTARAGGVRHKLTVAENASLEVYDDPGFYAQKKTGEAEARSRHTGGVNVALADGSVRNGGDPDQPVIAGSVPNAAPHSVRTRLFALVDRTVHAAHPGGANILWGDGTIRGVHAAYFDPNFQGGIFVATSAGARALIHPWPPRPGPGPMIVVSSGWPELAEAARQTRQVTLIVDM